MEQNPFYGGSPVAESSSQGDSMQQQSPQQQQHLQPTHAIIGWAATPITAYQLVPMEYQPVYAAAGSPGGGQQTPGGAAAGGGAPAVAGFAAMTPMSPTRHMSMNLGMGMGMGMGMPALQGAVFGVGMMHTPGSNPVGGGDNSGGSGGSGGGHHNMQRASQPQLYQHFVQPYAGHPDASGSQAQPGGGPPPASPMSGSFQFSPIANNFSPYGVIFAPTPPTLRQQTSADLAAARDLPPPPATLPRPAKGSSLPYSPNAARKQQHRPHPLALHPVPAPLARDDDWTTSPPPRPVPLKQPQPQRVLHGRTSSQILAGPAAKRPVGLRATTPAVSDHDYDGGGSAYSTSPLGSEGPLVYGKQHASGRAMSESSSQYDYGSGDGSDEGDMYQDGFADDRSSDDDGDEGDDAEHRVRYPFSIARRLLKPSASDSTLVPERSTVPARLRRRENSTSGLAAAAKMGASDGGPPSPTPASRAERLRANSAQLARPATPAEQDRDGSSSSCVSARSSVYTGPHQGLHQGLHQGRHCQMAARKDAQGGVCTCGIQQCAQCGLFVSQPDKHQCLAGNRT